MPQQILESPSLRRLLAVVILSSLWACGQKGPLSLPGHAPHAHAAQAAASAASGPTPTR